MRKKSIIVVIISTMIISSCGNSVDVQPVEHVKGVTNEQREKDSKQAVPFPENINEEEYVIEYYLNNDSRMPSEMKTTAVSGLRTKILTVDELNFSQSMNGYKFLGWRVNRDCDNKWYLIDSKGNKEWYQLQDGNLPEGFTYDLRNDGGFFRAPTKTGKVRLYGQWEKQEQYTIYYYNDIDSDSPSSEITIGINGEKTEIKTVYELGFQKSNRIFKGWRLYRDIDQKWYLKKGDQHGWYELSGDKLPDGYIYDLREDGGILLSPTNSGSVCLYAEWEDVDKYETYLIEYYYDETMKTSFTQKTLGACGIKTRILTIKQLGIEKEGYHFDGWRIYRDVDNKWFLKNDNGEKNWVALESDGQLPKGYSYDLRQDGGYLLEPTRSGKVFLVAQWSKQGK